MVSVLIFLDLEMEMRTCGIPGFSDFSDFFSLFYLLSDFYFYFGKMSVGGVEGLIVSLVFDDDNISSVASAFCYDNFSIVTCVDGGSGFCGDVYSLVRANSNVSSFEVGTESEH
jgi:hypothetical protein